MVSEERGKAGRARGPLEELDPGASWSSTAQPEHAPLLLAAGPPPLLWPSFSAFLAGSASSVWFILLSLVFYLLSSMLTLQLTSIN